MTLNELRNSVLALGFEDGFDSDALFESALTRALYTIYTDRPRIAHRSLSVITPRGTLLSSSFIHAGGGVESFQLGGKAYSFKLRGEGYYVLDDGINSTSHSFSCDTTVRGYLERPTQIRFMGEYEYAVSRLAFFRERFSSRVGDIPIYGDTYQIDLGEEIPDLLSPIGVTYVGDCLASGEIEVRDRLLALPYGFRGEVEVTYKRMPRYPDPERDDERIDISEEASELLPLLVASYVWLDDDVEKSQYYMSLYKDLLSTIARENATRLSYAYVTNGWA